MNTRTSVKIRIAFSLAALVASAAAFAAVTFDPDTGKGYVGKGDVQLPFGYNNAVMQSHHTHIQFSYLEAEIKTQECYSVDKGNFTLEGHRTKSQGLSATLDSSSRKTGQWTGWFLHGFEGEPIEIDTGWTTEDGKAAPNGCPEGSSPKGSPVVVQSGKGLYATDADNTIDQTHLIWASTAE